MVVLAELNFLISQDCTSTLAPSDADGEHHSHVCNISCCKDETVRKGEEGSDLYDLAIRGESWVFLVIWAFLSRCINTTSLLENHRTNWYPKAYYSLIIMYAFTSNQYHLSVIFSILSVYALLKWTFSFGVVSVIVHYTYLVVLLIHTWNKISNYNRAWHLSLFQFYDSCNGTPNQPITAK